MTTSTLPHITHSKQASRSLVLAARAAGKSTGVVMTMGALHAGHVSLVEACCQRCDHTTVTIFVNPTQFLPGEDFEKYPRDLAADLDVLKQLPVDVVLCPSAAEIYDEEFSTFIQPPRVAEPLEGRHRPGHFIGVCTVVFKLLQAAPVDTAFFGHKDYQQYLVLHHMARDLDLSVEIEVLPTIREADGLALSSRNRFLGPSEREQALSILRGLRAAAAAFQEGERRAGRLATLVRESLVAAGVDQIDYVAVCDPETLADFDGSRPAALALVAARIGPTRLIDNLRLDTSLPPRR